MVPGCGVVEPLLLLQSWVLCVLGWLWGRRSARFVVADSFRVALRVVLCGAAPSLWEVRLVMPWGAAWALFSEGVAALDSVAWFAEVRPVELA